jgi:hypothetical protein
MAHKLIMRRSARTYGNARQLVDRRAALDLAEQKIGGSDERGVRTSVDFIDGPGEHNSALPFGWPNVADEESTTLEAALALGTHFGFW